MPRSQTDIARPIRLLVLAGMAAAVLTGCASPRLPTRGPDLSAQSPADASGTLGQLAARYTANPKDRNVAIAYAAALRAANQPGQAIAVMEASLAIYKNDPVLHIAYAKALTAEGRFSQALTVIDQTIRPDVPDWNALSVKGAILDQTGQHEEARQLYTQALTIAPGEASLYANLGLSYSLTNDLTEAEKNLRRAAALPGATSQIRQNLALVVGLQGRFDEAKALYAAELPPDQVEANMAYVRGMLTQQNRWAEIQGH